MKVKFSHVIFYVKNISDSLAFFEQAFDLLPAFIHESGVYAELKTDGVTLGFVAEDFVKGTFPDGFVPNSPHSLPQACEIAFTTHDIENAYQKALLSGAHSIVPPELKPWGQMVAYVRDPSGILIELCTPIGGG